MKNRLRMVVAAAAVTLAGATLAGAGTTPALAAGARLSPNLAADLDRLAPTTAYTGFIHFDAPTSAATRAATLRTAGLRPVKDYDHIGTVYAAGTVAGFEKVAGRTGVSYIERNEKLTLADDTAGWATGTQIVQKPVSGGPYRTGPGGAILDGAGVGLAMLDSGMDGSHPDLINRLKTNLRFACSLILVTGPNQECFPAPVAMGRGGNSDTTSGHGTFTTGLAAGDGTASNGTFLGAAPGASVHGFAIGAGMNVLYATEALEHIYLRYDAFTPRIKIINNSWGNGAGSEYDPEGIIELITNKLVTEKGVTMVWAANNDGNGTDSGAEDQTNSYCKNPTAGVICVANYDDLGTGSRAGGLDFTSSRGKAGQQNTYPDVSAPGAQVVGPCQRTGAVLCDSLVLVSPALSWEPYYGTATGTSASAPIVAGGIAILLQRDPSLTPAQVENLLLDTAHQFSFGAPYEADSQNPGGYTSYDKGAGLVDIVAALNTLGTAKDNNAAGTVTIATGDGGDVVGPGAVDIVSATAMPGAAGVTYTITVANGSDQTSPFVLGLRVTQNVNGTNFRTDIDLTPTGAAPNPAEAPDDAATAEATSASRSGNVVTFFVPYTEIGNPPATAPAHNVFVSSFNGVVADVAPGPGDARTVGLDVLLRPEYASYTAR